MRLWLALGWLMAGLAGAAEPADDARWMEGAPNPRFDAWMAAEGVAARDALHALPSRAEWARTLRPLAAAVQYRGHTLAGERVLALRSQAGAEAQLVVREASGRERVLLAPDTAYTAITAFAVAPDGRSVAVNLRRGGSEVTRVIVVDTHTGRLRRDVLDDVWGEFAVSWWPGSGAFSYVQLAPPAQRAPEDFWLHQRTRLHRLGSAAQDDAVLLAGGLNPRLPLAPEEVPTIEWPGGGLALATIVGAQAPMRLCVAPAPAVIAKPARAPWRCLADASDGIVQAQVAAGMLYLISVKDAPGGRLLRLPLHLGARLGEASEVLPEAPGTVLANLAVARDGVYAQRMQGGVSQLLRLPFEGDNGFAAAKGVPLPVDGSIARLEADTRTAGVLVVVQNWTTPRQAWRWQPEGESVLADMAMGTRGLPPFDDVQTEHLSVRSADGTEVPLTVLRRRDAQTDGDATALLEGYAGYGVSLEPVFDPYRLAFAQAGQVVAQCHARGGGELGEAWRRGGQGANKERGVEDFIACAEALRARGLARRVVARGASMGGVLVGGALTRAPEAFDAAIVVAGILNPSRLAVAPNGANQFAEVGDPRTPEGLAQVQAMDPVLRVRDGQRYPPVLLLVGLQDQRVAPWFSGKFAARLRAAHAANTVWLRTDAVSGHFATAGDVLAAEWADQFAFALQPGAAP